MDELICTEMILEGFFTELDSAEAAALLSTLVFEERVQEEPHLTENLQKACACISIIFSVTLFFRVFPLLDVLG